MVHLLDYLAGNVHSLVNAIEKVGYTIKCIKAPEDIEQAQVSGIGFSTSRLLIIE